MMKTLIFISFLSISISYLFRYQHFLLVFFALLWNVPNIGYSCMRFLFLCYDSIVSILLTQSNMFNVKSGHDRSNVYGAKTEAKKKNVPTHKIIKIKDKRRKKEEEEMVFMQETKRNENKSENKRKRNKIYFIFSINFTKKSKRDNTIAASNFAIVSRT